MKRACTQPSNRPPDPLSPPPRFPSPRHIAHSFEVGAAEEQSPLTWSACTHSPTSPPPPPIALFPPHRSFIQSVCCRGAEPVDMERFAGHLANSYIPNTVIIDATASEVPPALYLQWMQKGIHIITPKQETGIWALGPVLGSQALPEGVLHPFLLRGNLPCNLPCPRLGG